MTTDPVDTLAQALIRAHQTGIRADLAPCIATRDDALRVQAQVQKTLGDVGGFKVAPRPDGPPFIAPIRADRVLPSGADVPVNDQMGIELEIGFELLTSPGPDMFTRPQDYFRPRVIIELVDTRLTSPAADDTMMKLADMQINKGLILGPVLDGWDGRDFGTVNATLRVGDALVQDGQTQVPGGSALSNLALFCDHVGDHCGGFSAGQTIITGSLTGLHYFGPGNAVQGRIDGFGDITCTVI